MNFGSFLVISICVKLSSQYKLLNISNPFRSIRYNPDVDLNVPQIIARHGYMSETHVVVSKDGYLLTLHRIPRSKNGSTGNTPVFLQHGLLGSSADWIINGNNSLAFLLSDTGYDVWLGNARGNAYSKGHVSLSVEDPRFWNFSWYEMGVNDLPACFNYIASVTQKSADLHYIGHSMGTTMFFVYASEVAKAAENVKQMIALAPVANMTHIKSPIRYLAPFTDDVQWISKMIGLNQFLPNDKLLKFLAYDCELLHIDQAICENILFILCGFDKAELNQDILPVIFSKLPSGTSTKTVLHYSQEIKNGGVFRNYDYGTKGNMEMYGTTKPPKFNVSNIEVPVYFMYGMNDWLASYIDVNTLSKQVGNLIGIYKIPMDSFNHIDFLFGKDAEKLVYRPILKLLSTGSL
ncbi:hypothetical protein GWI33_002675 [Rhynchophorus ferrugineus]|uniref:Lipase n=1 Tax=Rhynchophorus ferrugineus TaxID=354439 RepID=A0A834IYF5_RHYFE|nr:hypothetical protein GWI33_002675 [Rhynchophorus ferrugineus]